MPTAVLASSLQAGGPETAVFWILAPLAVLFALGMVFSRNTVHCALMLGAVMLILAVFYAAQDAPFLAFVQVIVYTGAVMMLFLFVLMLIGVDTKDSLAEMLRGQRIAAALFMVLANRYDWQLFLEITGEGGSGKSVFTHIATMLAGAHNTASGNMAALDSARGRAQFVGKSMITLPDQPKYSGEGTGIKAITGGDAVEIDPKHEHQYTAVLRAVVVATNNTPMIFTERAGGVSRRRVIFQFNRRVSEEDKDPDLAEKISAEIPVVVRRLLANFANPEKARALLLEQRNSEEALEVKQKTDPLYAFCAHLERLADCAGMMVGNRNPPHYPRIYLYHAYLAFLEANGFDKPLTLNKFAEGMESAMREFNHEYRKERRARGMVTNVELSESAEDWLPQTHPVAGHKE